jgi:hypothetical protein
MLGKTYLRLEKEEQARYYLKLASLYPPQTDDDLQVRQISVRFIQVYSLLLGGLSSKPCKICKSLVRGYGIYVECGRC